MCSFRKYTFEYKNLPNFADVGIFYEKQHFLTKKTNLVTGPSFMSIAGSGAITIFIYKVQWLSLLNNFF